MSTGRTAQVFITNETDGTARIQLWHNNSDYGTESGEWTAAPGATVGPLTVHFKTGFGSFSVLDYWACEIEVTDGTTPGLFESSGVLEYSNWKECQLQHADADQTLTFGVSTQELAINLRSGGTTTPMNRVERVSADVFVTNDTGGEAIITLFHNNSTDGTQSATWPAAPGERVGPLTTYFRVGMKLGYVLDYWAIKAAVKDGPAPGIYQSNGSADLSSWKECQLQAADAGTQPAFTVDTHTFDLALPSGGCSANMSRYGDYRAIDNVFVLMLENHSFDNMFAFSGIDGLRVATPNDTNTFNGQTYAVGPAAPSAMPTDPGHEFDDTVEQLCGEGATHTPWTPYNQPITMGGFVANYATTRNEITHANPNLPTAGEYGDIMQGFDTPNQLPVIHALATEFAVCDAWHASVPGPTWPNRFFVHGASSAGWADSPTSSQIAKWEVPGEGFIYPSGSSIYDKLTSAGLDWRIYADGSGTELGAIPQVSALKGIVYWKDTHNAASLAADLQGPYPYAYTFIEPNYGDVTGGSYTGGSSQHPMDSTVGGETLIKQTYEAIRNSPAWERSLLIITYDEHGGFYDSVPPGPATRPDDGSPQDSSINKHGFLFDWLGVRVPAVVVSPLIPQGQVDHTAYDHASVAATLEALHGFSPMTQRDTDANNVLHLLSLQTPRTDCPTTLPTPVVPRATAHRLSATAVAPDTPIPTEGNTQGFLQILAKTDMELTRGDPSASEAIRDRVANITTVGEAQDYAREVIQKARLAQAQRDSGPPQPPGGIPSRYA